MHTAARAAEASAWRTGLSCSSSELLLNRSSASKEWCIERAVLAPHSSAAAAGRGASLTSAERSMAVYGKQKATGKHCVAPGGSPDPEDPASRLILAQI